MLFHTKIQRLRIHVLAERLSLLVASETVNLRDARRVT